MATQCKDFAKTLDNAENRERGWVGEGGGGGKVERGFDKKKEEEPYIEPWTPECESTNAGSTAAGSGLFPPTCA